MPEAVDYDIMKDILKCSDSVPYSFENNFSNLYVVRYLAFPDPFQFGWMGTLKKIITKETYVAPVRAVNDWFNDLFET